MPSREALLSPFAAAGAPQPGQTQDFNKIFKAERENLEFAEGVYSWIGENVEQRVLKTYGKVPH